MGSIFFVCRVRRRIIVEAAAAVIDIGWRTEDILEPSLEITYRPADISFQSDIGIIVPYVQPLQVKIAIGFDIPLLVSGLVAVFRMPEHIIIAGAAFRIDQAAGIQARRIEGTFHQLQRSANLKEL